MNWRTRLSRGLNRGLFLLGLFLLGCSAAARHAGAAEPAGQEMPDQEQVRVREPVQEQTQEQEQAPSPSPLPPLDSREPSPAEVQAILSALGCGQADRLPNTCRHCVGLDGDLRPRNDIDEGWQMGNMEIVLGRFAEGQELGAMVTVTGCTDRASGDHDVSILGLERGTWIPVATWSYNDGAFCVYPRRLDGREHIVCAVSQGSQGCYDTELDSPRALPLQRVLGPQAEEDCAGRIVSSLATHDVDSDGDDDVVIMMDGQSRLLRQEPGGFADEAW